MSPAHQLQDDISAYLTAAAELTFVPVTEIKVTSEAKVANIIDNLNKTLTGVVKKGGKGGLGVLVPLPSFKTTEQGLPGPQGKLITSIQIIANDIINAGDTGTGIEPFELATQIANMLHRHSFNGRNQLVATEITPLPLPRSVMGNVAYEVIVEIPSGMGSCDKVLMPVIAQGGSDITITCGTGSAAIWYTTDGSLPTPGNAEATEYSAPFTNPAAATVIRAAAYKTGKAGSPSSQHTVT